jgi:hypothetical protein
LTNPARPPTYRYSVPFPAETITAEDELPVMLPFPRLPTIPPTCAAPVIDPPDTWTFVYSIDPSPAKAPVHPLVFVEVREGLTRVRFLI